MAMTIKQTFDGLNDLRKAMAALTDQDVLIGIPEDKAAREAAGDTGISNAYLGYIHEHGVPEKNIPARPFLLPGIEKVQPEIAAALKVAAQKALAGNEGAVDVALNKIGLLGQNSVRAAFVDNDWPALAEKTLNYQPLKKDDDGEAQSLADGVSGDSRIERQSGYGGSADGHLSAAGAEKVKKGNARRKKSRQERGRVNPLIDTGQLRKSVTYVMRSREK